MLSWQRGIRIVLVVVGAVALYIWKRPDDEEEEDLDEEAESWEKPSEEEDLSADAEIGNKLDKSDED